MSFSELGIRSPLTGNLRRMGCQEPWPVQAAAIPPILEGRDLIGLSRTGTGKTIAFITPILQRMQAESAPQRRGQKRKKGRRRPASSLRALVLCPTRELARQVAAEADRIVQLDDGRVVG